MLPLYDDQLAIEAGQLRSGYNRALFDDQPAAC